MYEQILALHKKVTFTEFPLKGALEEQKKEKNKNGLLWLYDFEKQELEVLVEDVQEIEVNLNRKTLLYTSAEGIRVLEAGASVPEDDDEIELSRKTGWLDLDRIRASIEIRQEWEQMFHEAWRLQKEFFWDEQMSGIDWEKIYQRYVVLLPKIYSRAELSDLIWEMQGELGTSHAYEYGGDYPRKRQYTIGRLGADIEFDPSRRSYVIQRIYQGDLWQSQAHSPLAVPGINVQEGDALVAIGGIPLTQSNSPHELLIHQAEQNVQLTVRTVGQRKTRRITVKTLPSEQKHVIVIGLKQIVST